MIGIFKLAYELLVNDKAKFTALLIGMTVAVFGMIFATAMFIGVLTHASSTVINIGAKVWVMDPSVRCPCFGEGSPPPRHLLHSANSRLQRQSSG